MQLTWTLHPAQINIQQAVSAAYQYTLISYNDGRAELSVQHRGDRSSATPIKRFVYKNHRAAIGGAKRFEDKHGYREEEIERINRLCAMAWYEGYEHGVKDMQDQAEVSNYAVRPHRLNPYRKTETTEE
jgi:hypothetical protein